MPVERGKPDGWRQTFGSVADNLNAGPGKHYGVTREQWSDPSAMNLSWRRSGHSVEK
jgi:hypothetical protein